MQHGGRTTTARRWVGALVLLGALVLGAVPAAAQEASVTPVEPAPEATGATAATEADPPAPGTEEPAEGFEPIDPVLVEAVVETGARLADLDRRIDEAQVALVLAAHGATEAADDLDAAEGALDRTQRRIERATAEIAAIEDLLRAAAVGEFIDDGAAEDWVLAGLRGDVDDEVLRGSLVRLLAMSTDDLIDDLEERRRTLGRQRTAVVERRDELVDRREALEAAQARHGREAEDLRLLRAEVLVVADEAQTALDEALAARQELVDAMLAAGVPLLDGGLTLDGVPLCDASGIVVACPIGPQVAALLSAAADDGLVLTGSGWRSTEDQIRLRVEHCGGDVFGAPASSCSPPTARPGSSNHELGVAVDFDDCATRDTPCFAWLAENAHRYGLFNLPSEPWHWSIDGS
jgi:hypothetical protein